MRHGTFGAPMLYLAIAAMIAAFPAAASASSEKKTNAPAKDEHGKKGK